MRGFRVLMAFSFRAAPREATFFLLSGAVMSLVIPVASYGSKLLVDGALAGDSARVWVAAAVLTVAGAGGLLNGLFYIDLLFTVVEKASAAIDRQLMALMA